MTRLAVGPLLHSKGNMRAILGGFIYGEIPEVVDLDCFI